MDAVKAFNAELLSMMDMKPPVSRAKMMSITKAGIKAIKLYKHVVQIIEKFIKRCSPELKVPGLYVVDSIIRQSRHQFGDDKDVFGPRFLKNITDTFHNLYQCSPDDKAKIVRVLNLWQKNSVFGMDVIQPLLDMSVAPSRNVLENGGSLGASPAAVTSAQLTVPASSTSFPSSVGQPLNTEVFPEAQNSAALPQLQNSSALTAIAQFLQSAQSLDLQQVLQNLQQAGATGHAQPAAPQAPPTSQKNSIAKVLLDRFDYDEEPEVPEEEETTPTNLPDLQQALQAHLIGQLSSQLLPNVQAALQALMNSQAETGTEQATAQTFAAPQPPPATEPSRNDGRAHVTAEPLGPSLDPNSSRRDDRDGRYSRRSRSRSPRRRSSSPRSRSDSRSASRSQRSRFRDSPSRSRDLWRSPPKSHVEDRRERDRRPKGIPPIRKETLSVCSTTLWIGQLDKKTQQQDITSMMEEFGQIQSVNMIPPRGCAYVVMVHRHDAYSALNRLSRGSARINNKPFKVAWALNKGVSTRFKKYWDVDLGVTYIPWSKLKAGDIEALCDGGMLDQETMRPEWAAAQKDVANPVGGSAEGPEGEQADGAAGPQVSVVSEDVLGGPPGLPAPPEVLPLPGVHGGPLLPVPLSNFSPTPMSPAKHVDALPTDLIEDPQGQVNVSGAPLLPIPPAGALLGVRPGRMHPPRPPLPFMGPFQNHVPSPNMPPVNMPPFHMPHGPMFRGGRIRMPMPPPHLDDFPPPRDGFPHPPAGPMEGDPWEEGPYRNDWQDFGPHPGPEWFGEEPPFGHGGWPPGLPRGRARGRGRFAH